MDDVADEVAAIARGLRGTLTDQVGFGGIWGNTYHAVLRVCLCVGYLGLESPDMLRLVPLLRVMICLGEGQD